MICLLARSRTTNGNMCPSRWPCSAAATYAVVSPGAGTEVTRNFHSSPSRAAASRPATCSAAIGSSRTRGASSVTGSGLSMSPRRSFLLSGGAPTASQVQAGAAAQTGQHDAADGAAAVACGQRIQSQQTPDAPGDQHARQEADGVGEAFQQQRVHAKTLPSQDQRLWFRPALRAFTSPREVGLCRNAGENFVFIGCAAA